MTRRVLTWARAHARTLTFLATAGLSFLASDCALRAAEHAATNEAPRLVLSPPSSSLTIRSPALFPETVVHDAARDRLLVGSFRRGAIYAVDDAGGATAIVDEPRLCSVLGIAIDEARGRVWAVNSDLGASAKPSAAGAKKLAAVGVYDLSTGEPLLYVDLAPLAPGPHLLNGIALDADGSAYVTDSFAPVIYKVRADGEATVFAKSERFEGAGINLNGVVVHPDGYLLVVKKSDGQLFKVPLDHPEALSGVAVSTRFVGGDGLLLVDDRSLVIVANKTPDAATNAVFALSTDDGFASARVDGRIDLGDVYPTTAVQRGGGVYVVHSRLNELIQGAPEVREGLRTEAVLDRVGDVRR